MKRKKSLILMLYIVFYPIISNIICIIFIYYQHLPSFFVNNKFQTVHIFHRIQITNEDNNSTLLIPTETTYKKSAIFGLISCYSPWKIRLFIDSLACTGYNGTIILLCHNNRFDTIQYILNFSIQFEIIIVPVEPKLNYFIPNSSFTYYKNNQIIKTLSTSKFNNTNFVPLEFVSGDYRFEVAYSMYLNNFFNEYEIILFCDIGDVLFQDNFQKYNFTNGVYLTEEAQINIKKSHFWMKMFKGKEYKKFKDKIELCAGVLFLVGRESYSFLADLHDQIYNNLNKIRGLPNFQGTLNYLIYNKTKIYPEGFIHFITTEHGIVNNIGKFGAHLYSFNKKTNNSYTFYDVYYHDENYFLYNYDFQKLAIIHHTKYIKETQRLTYKGILNYCSNKYPKQLSLINKLHDDFQVPY